MPPKSELWKHFVKNSDNKSAVCRHCGKIIKTSGNTSNLKCHLESKHSNILSSGKKEKVPIEKKSLLEQNAQPPPKVLKLNYNIEKSDEETAEVSLVTVSSESSSSSSLLQFHCQPSTSGHQTPKSQKTVSGIFQKTITDSFKKMESFKEGGSINHKITQAISYMICKDCEPFSIVEHKGFKKLLKTIAPLYEIPSRFTIKRLINDKYEVIVSLMKNKLIKKAITLTTDIWTDTQMRSFMSLTVHFYDTDNEEQNLFSGTLGIFILDSRHTAEYLAGELKSICKEWGIADDQITAVVTDNATNIKKSIEIAFGAKKHIPCFAHTLNLVAEKALEKSEEATSLILKVKNVVSWFKHSVIASDELRKLGDKKLIQSVPTRWNSTFYMLKRFIELRRIVNDIVNRHPTAPPMLNASEIEDITEICEILQPLEAATSEISGENYLTTSLVIPLVSIMHRKIQNLNPEKQIGKKLLKELFMEFSRRFGAVEHVHLLAMATLLDPRFKKIYFKSPLTCSKHINHISGLIYKQATQHEQTDSSSSDSEVMGKIKLI